MTYVFTRSTPKKEGNKVKQYTQEYLLKLLNTFSQIPPEPAVKRLSSRRIARRPLSLTASILIGTCLVAMSSPVEHLQAKVQNFQANNNHVRFAIMELSPYGYFDDAGSPKGYLYDLAKLVIEKAEIDGEIEIFPVKRMERNIVQGTWDCTFVLETEISRQNYHLIEKIGKNLSLGIIPKKGVNLDNFQNLHRYSIAVPDGIPLTNEFDSHANLTIVRTGGHRHSARMLANNRLDAIAGAISSLNFSAEQVGLTPQNDFGKPLYLGERELWFACSHDMKNPEMIQTLKNTVASLRKGGGIGQIIEPYERTGP